MRKHAMAPSEQSPNRYLFFSTNFVPIYAKLYYSAKRFGFKKVEAN
jgi:hypothetical protein